MRLADKGQLRFEDPIADYLPKFGVGGKSSITIRDVLSHSAGLHRVAGGPYVQTYDDIINEACRTELPRNWDPQRHRGYSLFAASHVLAAVTTVAGAKPFADLLDREVFHPLGLSNSAISEEQLTQPLEAPYRRVRDRLVSMSFYSSPGAVGTLNPAFGAYGPSFELATIFDTLRLSLEGRSSFLSTGMARRMVEPGKRGLDQWLGYRCSAGLGVLTSLQDYNFGDFPEDAFGHHSDMGTWACVLPAQRATIVLHLNGVPEDHKIDPRRNPSGNPTLERCVRALMRDRGASKFSSAD